MNAARKRLSPKLETAVLTLSRRRCCLCVFLDHRDEKRPGQIAHLNRVRSDNKFGSLAWLCLDHHDEYDSRTSQSKGLTEGEVRHYRDKLIQRFDGPNASWPETIDLPFINEGIQQSDRIGRDSVTDRAAWRFPMWLVTDQLELFAYKAHSADGVCLIERIDLPDGRIVIVCVQPPGNPGSSITNSAELIASQVCERFEISASKLVWLEHYLHIEPAEWDRVSFEKVAADGSLAGPRWIPMDEASWRDLRLRPKKFLRTDKSNLRSKLTKLFPAQKSAAILAAETINEI